jgi:hypothetical protein
MIVPVANSGADGEDSDLDEDEDERESEGEDEDERESEGEDDEADMPRRKKVSNTEYEKSKSIYSSHQCSEPNPHQLKAMVTLTESP